MEWTDDIKYARFYSFGEIKEIYDFLQNEDIKVAKKLTNLKVSILNYIHPANLNAHKLIEFDVL